MKLKDFAAIELGRPYYFFSEKWCRGLARIVFTRFESPQLVSGSLDEPDFPTDLVAAPVYLFKDELADWGLYASPEEAGKHVSHCERNARGTARRQQPELASRLAGSGRVIRILKQLPEVVRQIQHDLAQFRAGRRPGLDGMPRAGHQVSCLGYQSLNGYQPGCHDHLVTRADGTTFAVTIDRGFIYDRVLRHPVAASLEERHPGAWPATLTIDNFAIGPVLEWLDRLPLAPPTAERIAHALPV